MENLAILSDLLQIINLFFMLFTSFPWLSPELHLIVEGKLRNPFLRHLNGSCKALRTRVLGHFKYTMYIYI